MSIKMIKVPEYFIKHLCFTANSSDRRYPRPGRDARQRNGSRLAESGFMAKKMISQKFSARFELLKDLAQDVVLKRLDRIAPSLVDDVRHLAKHPRAFGTWLEGKSPWLNRRFLGAASNVAEPFLLGMGLRVEKLGEDSVEVFMPGSWRNQGESGDIHTSALSAMGEFAARLFWEYHLDLRKSEIVAVRLQVRLLSRATGHLKGVFRLPVAEREAILHRLRAEGKTEVDSQTLIYDSDGRLVAEIETEWLLSRQAMMSGSHL
jgi:acyl-coenzyme A thioesterase PaaI-like protein